MQRVITAMKRNSVVNKDTGRVDLRYNPLSIEEDYYIPVRGGTKFAEINEVGGQERTHDIDDVKYLRDKLFSALKVPASYLTQGEEGSEDKTTLAQKDIRFARTVQRLQRSLVTELEKIGIVHLHTLGFRGDDLVNFSLSLNNPSKIAEIQELEHWNQKFSIATNATEGFFSKRWVAEHLFGLSEEEFMRNKREMYHDRKYEAELNAAGEAAGQMATAGAAMGLPDTEGGLPDMPGGFEVGEGLPGAEEPTTVLPEPEGDTTGPETGGDGEASPLLATPGKRDKDFKKRDGRKSEGPRSKSYRRIATPESMTGATKRSMAPGLSDLAQLSKGIYAEQFFNHEKDEERIFSINYETKALLENLNKMELKSDEA